MRSTTALALGVLSAAACSGCGTPSSWALNVMNLTSQPVVVQPWAGGPKTTLGCQQSVTLHAGMSRAPDLPWHIVVILESDGQVLLDTEATAQLPPQDVVIEPGSNGSDTAFMRQAGGRWPRPAAASSDDHQGAPLITRAFANVPRRSGVPHPIGAGHAPHIIYSGFIGCLNGFRMLADQSEPEPARHALTSVICTIAVDLDQFNLWE
jgi:hypothetical protein